MWNDLGLVNAFHEVCAANNLPDAYEAYSFHRTKLAGWRFIFSSDKGNHPGTILNFNFSSVTKVRSLFEGEKVFVLDEATLSDMFQKEPIRFDYSISLDTNALSCLEPFLRENTSRLPGDFKEVFEFIARDEVNVDPLPYRLENMMNIGDVRNAEKIYKKLKGYEFLRFIDARHLKETGVLRSLKTDDELIALAQTAVSRMLRDADDPLIRNTLYRRHNLFMCLLLKMCELQFTSGLSINQKVYRFVEFLDVEFAAIMHREALLARKFFEQGTKLHFFSKCQIKSAGLFKSLRGMAWDLLHLRHSEEMLSIRPNMEARYFFTGFLSSDWRLVEVIDLYPIRTCALSPDGQAIPFFGCDFQKIISDGQPDQEQFENRFFSDEARSDRASRHKQAQRNPEDLLLHLAKSVAGLAQISVPDNIIPG